MRLYAIVALVALAALAGPAWADVSKLNEAGKAAYARGDFVAAERLFREAIRGAPEEPLLHYHLAGVLTRLGQWDEAREGLLTRGAISSPPSGSSVRRFAALPRSRSSTITWRSC